MIFLSALAFAKDTLVYQYHAPAAAPDSAGATATLYAAKDEVFVATNESRLHAEPNAESKVSWEFPVGTPVTVIAAGATSVYQGFGGTWFQVQAGARTGWLHSSDLTPYAWTADFDQDGDTEVATVAFTSDFGIRVTVFEPDMAVANLRFGDLDSVGGTYLGQHGGTVRAQLLPANKAGLPLIHVYSGVEGDADFADYWVSYTSAGPARPGQTNLALQQGGLQVPPNCSSYAVRFDAKRHLAVVTRTEGGCGDKHSKPATTEARWVLVAGVYKVERPGGIVR